MSEGNRQDAWDPSWLASSPEEDGATPRVEDVLGDVSAADYAAVGQPSNVGSEDSEDSEDDGDDDAFFDASAFREARGEPGGLLATTKEEISDDAAKSPTEEQDSSAQSPNSGGSQSNEATTPHLSTPASFSMRDTRPIDFNATVSSDANSAPPREASANAPPLAETDNARANASDAAGVGLSHPGPTAPEPSESPAGRSETSGSPAGPATPPRDHDARDAPSPSSNEPVATAAQSVDGSDAVSASSPAAAGAVDKLGRVRMRDVDSGLVYWLDPATGSIFGPDEDGDAAGRGNETLASGGSSRQGQSTPVSAGQAPMPPETRVDHEADTEARTSTEFPPAVRPTNFYAQHSTFLGIGRPETNAAGADDDSDSDDASTRRSETTNRDSPASTAGATRRGGGGSTSWLGRLFGRGGSQRRGSQSSESRAATRADDTSLRVHTHKTDVRELSRLREVQHLGHHAVAGEAIWTAQWSLDGTLLATAGGNEFGGVIRIWRVIAADAVRDADGEPPRGSGSATADGSTAGQVGTQPGASPGTVPLFEPEPVREFVGHESHVVDLAWSRSQLVLSASMDGYVRLWHTSRPSCLHKFMHPDSVTSVTFHPSEDKYFLTGCFDQKLRIWSLETGRVVLWHATAAMVTSVAFSPDARYAVAGLYNGLVTLYQVDGLRYHTQIECRNRKGTYRKGRKVTGLEFMPGGTHLLVTTNDSRARLIAMDDFSQPFKYIGATNLNMQIRASFDSTGDRIICGSEDRFVYVWRTRHDHYTPHINPRLTGFQRHKVRSYEYFLGVDMNAPARAAEASGSEAPTEVTPADATTVALFAPEPTATLLRERRRAFAASHGILPPDTEQCAEDCVHLVIVTADSRGGLRVLESEGPLETV